MSRQKILITGASSGLGSGMARAFAAKGCDLALCARRTDWLDELKVELSQQYPDVKIAVGADGPVDAGIAAAADQTLRISPPSV